MEPKENIFSVISDEWMSTHRISKEAGVNWYRTEYLLNKLKNEGKIKLDEKPSGKYWKLR